MSTVYTCTEPKDAWSLVSHFLGNQLLVISLSSEVLEEEGKYISQNEMVRDRHEAVISCSRAQLIGNLYMLVRNMNAHGHDGDASKIQHILDMVTDQDVTKAEVREAIHAKNREFNANKREFDAAMAELRSKGAFQS
ncbi:MAG: hypothetical protein Q8P23_00645 [bacterium]|nr:hypothetical protein [bacterium]